MRIAALLLMGASLAFSQGPKQTNVPVDATPRDRAKQKSKADQQAKAPTPSPQPAVAPPAANASTVDKPPTPTTADPPKAQPKGIWTKAFGPETWANWVLVLVGAAGAALALRSLDSLQAQVEIGEFAANAASANAYAAKESSDALKVSERAWLLMKCVNKALLGADKFDWILTNAGRTTAKISEVGMRCRILDGMSKHMGDPPDYGTPIITYGVPIAPNDSMPFWCQFEKGEGADPTDPRLMDVDCRRIQRGADLVAYGYIKYLDSFNIERESRFCYYYALPIAEYRINLRAPAEYHRCT